VQKFRIAVCVPILLFLCAIGDAQSLGDVARQQRQKQQAKDAHPARKVVTNEEIPESPDASANSSADSDSSGESSTPDASNGGNKSAEQWKSGIQAQKARIAALQAQVDKLNDFGSLCRGESLLQWCPIQPVSVKEAAGSATYEEAVRWGEKDPGTYAGIRSQSRFRQRDLRPVGS